MIKKILLIGMIFLYNVGYAANASSQDSVMSPNGVLHHPTNVYQTATASSGNVYSYTYTTQYQTETCPSGLTVNGSTIYNSAQRQIVYSYLGSQLVGTNVGAWTDIDTDCTGTQTQVLACPAGYTGTFTQQRKVGTSTGGYVYGDWSTTAIGCVIEGESRYDSDNFMSFIKNNGSDEISYQNIYWDGQYNQNIPGGAFWPGQEIRMSFTEVCNSGHVENYFPEMIYEGYGYQAFGACEYMNRIGVFWFYKTGIKRRKIN